MLQTLLTGALAFLGVVIGAFLQHRLAHVNTAKAAMREARQEAYVDYIRTVALLAHSHEGKMELANAKARIVVYGTEGVIAKMAALETAGANLAMQKSMDAFLDLIQAMREDEGETTKNSSDVSLILFGSKDSELFKSDGTHR